MKGREYRGYVHVAATSVKTARALNHWLKQSLDFNQRTFGEASASIGQGRRGPTLMFVVF
jgi:hypothetical protein